MKKSISSLFMYTMPFVACVLVACNPNPPVQPKAVEDVTMYVNDKVERQGIYTSGVPWKMVP